jgi:hypothetical protein
VVRDIKRSLIVSAIIVIVTGGNVIRILEVSKIRTVEFLTILVLGAALGVFLTHLFIYLGIKGKKE